MRVKANPDTSPSSKFTHIFEGQCAQVLKSATLLQAELAVRRFGGMVHLPPIKIYPQGLPLAFTFCRTPLCHFSLLRTMISRRQCRAKVLKTFLFASSNH
eukprot:5797559-Amphidinium_carterae.1